MKHGGLEQAAVVYAAAVEARNAYLRLPAEERAAIACSLRDHSKVVRAATTKLLLEAKRHGSKAIQADWLRVKGRT